MKKVILIALLLVSFYPLINAQSKNNIFDFDYAQFANDSTSNYLEFYYTYYKNRLAQKTTDSGKYVEATLKLTIADSVSGKVLIDKTWLLNYPVTAEDTAEDGSLVGQILFIMPQGIYTCSVQINDKVNPANKKSINDKIIVHAFNQDELALSDIELASRIIPDSPNDKSMFYKNTFEVMPVPTEVFGLNLPVVFYYYELYDRRNDNSGTVYKLNSSVFNSKGKSFYNKTSLAQGGIPSRVEVGSIPVNKYPTDAYVLRIVLMDSANKIEKETFKRFFVYNPHIANPDTVFKTGSKILSTAFGTMTSEECDNFFAKCKYLASAEEVKAYSKLSNLEGKQEFLYQFWNKRDSEPSTPLRVTYDTYLQRIQESNSKYTNLRKAGWKTDRGRVLMVYGEPSEIERFPNQQDRKPYEIWHYNDLEGGVIFIFADLKGFSDYQLISSTKRGEIQDSNWQSRIASY